MRQDMTMDEVMEYQGRLYYLPKKVIRQKSDELLEFVGLAEYRHRVVRYLSGGMKRKLMICRALMTEPEILLLDEPTAALDLVCKQALLDAFSLFRQQGGLILMATHDLLELSGCDRVYLLSEGTVSLYDYDGDARRLARVLEGA